MSKRKAENHTSSVRSPLPFLTRLTRTGKNSVENLVSREALGKRIDQENIAGFSKPIQKSSDGIDVSNIYIYINNTTTAIRDNTTPDDIVRPTANRGKKRLFLGNQVGVFSESRAVDWGTWKRPAKS